MRKYYSLIPRNWALFLPMCFSLSSLSALIDYLEMRFNSAVNWASGSKIHFVYKCAIVPMKALDLPLLLWVELRVDRQNIRFNHGKKQIISKLIRRKKYKSLTCAESTKPHGHIMSSWRNEKLSKLLSSLGWGDVLTIYTLYCVHEKIYF